MTSKKIKNGRRPQKKQEKLENDLKKKMEDEKINLIGCDTIVNSPSLNYIISLTRANDHMSLLYSVGYKYLSTLPHDQLKAIIYIFKLGSFEVIANGDYNYGTYFPYEKYRT